MEILRIVLVFVVMAAVLWLKRPLYQAMLAATVAVWLAFMIPVADFFTTIGKSAIHQDTITVLLLFYFVCYLQQMLEQRGYLRLARQSLDGLFQNRRLTATLTPLVLGLLPAGGIVLICGDIVEQSIGPRLPKEEKAFITSFYRHIPESFIPTFASIYIPLSLTNGAVNMGAFVLAMLPMAAALYMLGYLLYLRKVPKREGIAPSANKKAEVRNLVKGLWPILLILVLILAAGVPAYIALAVAIVLFACIDKFRPKDLLALLKKAWDWRLLLSMLCIMIFKDTLMFAGAVDVLQSAFSVLPIPQMLVFALLFFLGTIISGSQAIAVIGIPLVFASVPGAGLSHFVLLMGIAYAANQITPVHICVPLAAEYFHIGFGGIVRKTLPVIGLFLIILIGYYFLLQGLGA